MPIELDKGHDVPIFGPEGRPNLAERFELAREIVRQYGSHAARLVPFRGRVLAARRSPGKRLD